MQVSREQTLEPYCGENSQEKLCNAVSIQRVEKESRAIDMGATQTAYIDEPRASWSAARRNVPASCASCIGYTGMMCER